MIVRDRPSGLRLFLVLRGSILSRIWRVLLVNVLLAIAVTMTHGAFFQHKVTLTAIPFTLIGLPLAIFLGFRNTAAYDRFWEGRKLWGELVLRSQNLARQCLGLIAAAAPQHPGTPDDTRARMIRRAIAYAYALRNRLRGDSADAGLDAGWLQPDEHLALRHSADAPALLMMRMGEDLGECVRLQRVDPCLAAAIDGTLSAMVATAVACDRIRNTPIPFSYTLLLHRTAYLYCFLLPFGLVDTIGFMTPFVVGIVAYTFFGLDALGDELEEPFGTSPNDLPLDALCRTIEIGLKEALGETDLPAPLAPVDYCLR
ncbi:bestrophin family protein [Cupriavidus basilensis]|uniref:Bestrophin family protein n=1 Tax=Cupriavidus basilensis TaxID=68895 RepID=A0ABT6AZ41_9BURK|nr:bestrophin family protein [Cupriavidus basilensis]MDF3837889.1 bestrophin family protein [Cupriavidus basilensis]